MPEQTEKIPNLTSEEQEKVDAQPTVDGRDLVSAGGFEGNPREIVENPAVTPEMPNEPGDIRTDLLEED